MAAARARKAPRALQDRAAVVVPARKVSRASKERIRDLQGRKEIMGLRVSKAWQAPEPKASREAVGHREIRELVELRAFRVLRELEFKVLREIRASPGLELKGFRVTKA